MIGSPCISVTPSPATSFMHAAALLGHDHMLHLHGLDHGELLARAHDLAFLHLDGDDGPLQGRSDHHRAFGHDLRDVRLGAVAPLRSAAAK